MKNNRGFTMIEVLMVVLVVGILASLAMPQYTKVVEKAKMSEAKTVLSAIRTAEGVYFMEYDAYTDDLTKLDLDEGIYTSSGRLFDYTIDVLGTVGHANFSFTITAERLGGAFAGSTMIMSADGTLSATGLYADENMVRHTSSSSSKKSGS
ncbi:hypothetical protein AB834_04605 [PVC group bacterium (ex Bugula neritina AB1)]|nr:hypothetical protein AB834_04605 [PVC group bacterium (ex Bugula neritina AB1)]